MKKLLLPFWRLYVWVIWLPIAIVLTALTAISCIIIAYLGCNPKVTGFPPKVWSKLMCWIGFIRVTFKGQEHLVKGHSYVIAANHQSAFDIWAIYGWLPVTFSWVMKMELRNIPLVGFACERVGHIFIDRSNPVKAKESLMNAESKLRNGHCVVIFPEGTRTKTGKVGKFKRGAFSISTELDLPILPVTIQNSFQCIAMNGKSINPGHIIVTVHKPIMSNGTSEQDMKELASQTREAIVADFPDNLK